MDRTVHSTALWRCPPIVYVIFENLPAKYLNTCAKVCKLWNGIAENVKRRRKRKIAHFFHNSGEIDINNSCLDATVDHINNLYNKPKCMIMFIANYQGYNFEHTVLDTLPETCDVGICTALNVIGTTPNQKEIQSFHTGSHGIAAVCFPYLTESDIYRFRLSGFPVGISFERDSDFYKYTGIPPDKPVKCFLIFVYDRIASSPSWDLTKTIVNFFIDKANGIAIGGAQIRRMAFPKYKIARRNQGYGIAFVGNRIEAASAIIPTSAEASERKEKLRAFCNIYSPNVQCIAFVFQNFKSRSTMADLCRDSIAFNELFPNVPLIGAVGLKELGFEYLPNDAKDYSSKKFPDSRSDTTVFIFIAIRN